MSSAPASPPAPKQYSVLFICLGNYCRSPMAEAIFRHHTLFRKPNPHPLIADVDSAGTGAYWIGSEPHMLTQEVLEDHNILNGEFRHIGRQVCEDDFARFDYILGMDTTNVKRLNFIKSRLEYRREKWLKDQETERRQREMGETERTLRQLRRRASAASNNADFIEASPTAQFSQHLHPDSAIVDSQETLEPEPQLEPVTPYLGPLAEIRLFGEFGGTPSTSKSKMRFKRSGQLEEEDGKNVFDPYGFEKPVFESVYNHLERLTKAFLKMLEIKEATRQQLEAEELGGDFLDSGCNI